MLKTLDDLIKNNPIKGQTVLVRADLNVPMVQGKISDYTRIARTVPTLQTLIKKGAKVVILSHFGRPKGEYDRDLSLAPIVDAISTALGGKEVSFGVDCIGNPAKEAVSKLKNGDVVLLENLRFHPEEKENDIGFARSLAELGDLYVNDAFSCSHRSHASITGLASLLPSAAGYLLGEELSRLDSITKDPKRPLMAIVGGSKISTKIGMLEHLAETTDILCIGGGMANTFLHAKGVNIGNSLCEKDLKKTALEILKIAEKNACEIILPEDIIVAKSVHDGHQCYVVSAGNMAKDHMILDVGPLTIAKAVTKMQKVKTVLWNGPLGAFEYSPFDVGTISLARAVASLTLDKTIESVAGGGDILSALLRAGLRDSFSYISTAGGAFLEYLEGKDLPGVKALMQ